MSSSVGDVLHGGRRRDNVSVLLDISIGDRCGAQQLNTSCMLFDALIVHDQCLA